MTRRRHNQHKRAQRQATAILRDVGILYHSAMPAKEVRVVDLRREYLFVPSRFAADLIVQQRWPWTVAMLIFTTARGTRLEISQYNPPCLQEELVAAMEEEHQQMLARVKIELGLEGKGEQVHSFGWLAMPVTDHIDMDKAERIFGKALATIKTAEAA